MKKIFSILFIILYFVGCKTGCSDSAIDTKLLLEPANAIIEVDKNNLSDSLDYFAFNVLQTHNKNQAPLSYSAELSKQAFMQAQVFKAKAPLNAVLNIDKLVSNLEIIKNKEITLVDENNYFKFLDDIKNLNINNLLRDIKSDLTNYLASKKDYDDLFYIVNKSIYVKNYRAAQYIFNILAKNAKDLIPKSIELTQSKLKPAEIINENIELLANLDNVQNIDSSLIKAVLSSFTIILTELKNNFATYENVKNDMIADLSVNFNLIKNLKGNIYPLSLQISSSKDLVKPLELTKSLDFDVNKLASSIIVQEINASKKIIVYDKNKYDGDIYAKYLSKSFVDKKVYSVDLFAFAKKALEYGLNDDEFIQYLAGNINKKVNAGLCVLHNVSALSYNYNKQTSMSDMQFINTHLDKLLSLINMPTVVLLENNLSINQTITKLPMLNLALSKAILNEIILDTDANHIDTRANILEIAKKIISLSPDNYSLGALYQIWQSYKISNASNDEKIVSIALDVGKVKKEQIDKKGINHLAWDFVDDKIKDNQFYFTNVYVYNQAQDSLEKSRFLLQLASIEARVKASADAGVAKLEQNLQDALNDIDTSKNTQITAINTHAQGIKTDISNEITKAQGFAIAANTSANSAKASENNAAQSVADAQAQVVQSQNAANEAQQRLADATIQATNAAKAAGQANTSANSAKASEDNAAKSVADAQAQVVQAQNAANEAQQRLADAIIQATNAAKSAGQAELAKQLSSLSAKTSENSANRAQDFSQKASTSEINALKHKNTAYLHEQKANENANKAQSNKILAELAKDKANTSANSAKASEDNATKAANKANIAAEEVELIKQEVEIAKKEAEFAKDEAEEAKKQAISAKDKSELAKIKSEIAKIEAQKAKDDAESAQVSAEISQEEAEKNSKDSANSANSAKESEEKLTQDYQSYHKKLEEWDAYFNKLNNKFNDDFTKLKDDSIVELNNLKQDVTNLLNNSKTQNNELKAEIQNNFNDVKENLETMKVSLESFKESLQEAEKVKKDIKIDIDNYGDLLIKKYEDINSINKKINEANIKLIKAESSLDDLQPEIENIKKIDTKLTTMNDVFSNTAANVSTAQEEYRTQLVKIQNDISIIADILKNSATVSTNKRLNHIPLPQPSPPQ